MMSVLRKSSACNVSNVDGLNPQLCLSWSYYFFLFKKNILNEFSFWDVYKCVFRLKLNWRFPHKLTALSCSNRSFIFDTEISNLQAEKMAVILWQNDPKYDPNGWIPQPAGELAVREEPDASKKEDRTSQETWQGSLKKRLFGERRAFPTIFHAIWLLGLNPSVFSLLNLLALGIKTTVV